MQIVIIWFAYQRSYLGTQSTLYVAQSVLADSEMKLKVEDESMPLTKLMRLWPEVVISFDTLHSSTKVAMSVDATMKSRYEVSEESGLVHNQSLESEYRVLPGTLIISTSYYRLQAFTFGISACSDECSTRNFVLVIMKPLVYNRSACRKFAPLISLTTTHES